LVGNQRGGVTVLTSVYRQGCGDHQQGAVGQAVSGVAGGYPGGRCADAAGVGSAAEGDD
jgi:hypothetical protein